MFRNLIGGEWINGADATANINPSDISDVIGDYALATVSDADQAVAAARAALPAWSQASPQLRHDILRTASDELFARKDEIGRLLSREEGKTLAEGIGETVRAAQIFGFFAGEALRVTGEQIDSLRPGVEVNVTREPVGVVGLITPWNFPIAIPAWKIAPALAYGNCVVLKPANLVPGCAWALADVLHRAGVPAGVFNLVMGRGSDVGQAIAEHPGIDAISFTGSAETSASIALAAARPPFKRVQFEMGGKNPLVVLDDADLDLAVDVATNGAFFSTGQRCTASSRLIVTDGIHDRFVAALQERMRALVVGNALDEKTDIGPAVDGRQLKSDLDYIEAGRSEGAKLVAGGNRLNRETEGFYLEPALFTEVDNAMRIAREEIFGPVAAVIRVRDFDEALVVANDTEFGLSAGICTTSLKHASAFRRYAEAGMVMVNLPTAGVDYHVPFGGRKGSSFGPREQGRHAKDFYTTTKTSYLNPA